MTTNAAMSAICADLESEMTKINESVDAQYAEAFFRVLAKKASTVLAGDVFKELLNPSAGLTGVERTIKQLRENMTLKDFCQHILAEVDSEETAAAPTKKGRGKAAKATKTEAAPAEAPKANKGKATKEPKAKAKPEAQTSDASSMEEVYNSIETALRGAPSDGFATKDIVSKTGLSESDVKSAIATLKADGRVSHRGTGRGTKYVLGAAAAA